MADDIIDPLKIKIETAKRQLPLETVNAIDSVDWKIAILGMRIRHGYTFEQWATWSSRQSYTFWAY